jgi:hypothetical protein
MIKIVSIEFLIGGTILLLFGIHESNSLHSDIFRLFTGLPTDKAMWMLAGGTVGLALGMIVLLHAYRCEVKKIYSKVLIKNIDR